MVIDDTMGLAAPAPAPPVVATVPLPPRIKVEENITKSFVIPKCWACKKVGGRRCFCCGVSGRKMADGELLVLVLRESVLTCSASSAPIVDGIDKNNEKERDAVVDQPGVASDAMAVDAAPEAAVPAPAVDGKSAVVDTAPGLMFRCIK